MCSNREQIWFVLKIHLYCKCVCLVALRFYHQGNVIIFVGHNHECQFSDKVTSALAPKTHLFHIASLLNFRLATNNCTEHIDWICMHVDIGPVNLFYSSFFLDRLTTEKHIRYPKNNKDFHKHTPRTHWFGSSLHGCLTYCINPSLGRDFVRFEQICFVCHLIEQI